jgi:alpha-N-arabinofuranosidase
MVEMRCLIETSSISATETTRQAFVSFRVNPMIRLLVCAPLAAVYVLAIVPAHAGIPVTLNVEVNKPGVAIPATFYGLMTEEINHSYDGGLFAELIQNRTFQDPAPRGRPASLQNLPIHWSLVGDGAASIERDGPVNSALPISLRLNLSGKMASVANDGFWGIPIRADTTYTASFYAKSGGGFAGPVMASLVLEEDNVTVAKANTKAITASGLKHTVTLTTAHGSKVALVATERGHAGWAASPLIAHRT